MKTRSTMPRLILSFFLLATGIAYIASCKKFSSSDLSSSIAGIRSSNLAENNLPLVVTTAAGSGVSGYVEGAVATARFNAPSGVVMDGTGNIYVADSGNHSIRRISSAGVVSTFAGNGTPGFADGTGTAARFTAPTGLAIGASGIIYVADKGNHRIRKITPAGNVSTLAGTGTPGFTEGPGSTAQFNSPTGIAADTLGNVYVADAGNHRIRLITSSAFVVTLAGTGVPGSADGPNGFAQFNAPSGVAVGVSGSIYVADFGNHMIREIASGIVSTLAGNETPGFAEGTGSAAQFNGPAGIVTDVSGNIYVADQNNHRIRQVTQAGVVSSLAGNGMAGFIDSTAPAARFKLPYGITTDAAGNLLIADKANHRIRKIAPKPLTVSTVTSSLFNPSSLTIDPSGTIYVADVNAHCIKKITPAGVVSIFAGSNDFGFVDGQGTAAKFWSPIAIKRDASGNLFVADAFNQRIRKITPDGNVTTLAGSGPIGFFNGGFAEGPGNQARFNNPWDLAVDHSGNLYVADPDNNRIRKITPAGIVSTLAGNGTAGFADGPGTTAMFKKPHYVTVDDFGNVYVNDDGNMRIRKITPAGTVTTLAASDSAGYVDGPADVARFDLPRGIAVDALGNIYIADAGNHRIRKLSKSGIVSTLAGSGVLSREPNDGPADQARFNDPYGIISASDGTIFITELYGSRIRKIQ